MAEEYQPITTSENIPEVDLAALTPTPSTDPLANMQQSMAIDQSDRLVKNSIADLRQSLSTPTADEMLRPIGYDPIATNRDRYVKSDYFGELGFNPFSNNEEIYGNAQSNFNKLKNAFTGMGALAWHQAVDQFKSWGDTFDVLGSQDISEAFKQTELEELSRKQNEMMNANAIFETQSDRDSIFNFNTIANTVQQSGFAVGAVAEIAAEEAALTYLTAVTFGGSSEIQAARTLKLASNIGKAAKRTAELSESINSASKMRKAFNAVQKATNLVNPLDNVMDFASSFKAVRRADELAFGATGLSKARTAARGFGALYRDVREFNLAVSEAKAEAAGTYTELSDQMSANFEQTYGRKPTDIELKDIQDEALRGAQANGAANTALILMSNKIAFGNILKGFKPLRYMMDEDIMKGLAVVGDKDALKIGKKVIEASDNRWLYYKNAIVSNPLKYVGANLSEALQENAQSISNDAVKSWYMAKYNGQELDSKFDAIREAAGNQFTTEGAKTFISGFFTGALLGAGSKVFEQAGSIQQYFSDKKGYEDRKTQEQKARSSVKDTINAIYANPLSYNYNKDNAAHQANFAALLKESAINKDKKAFNDIQDDAARQFILTGINTGMLDLLNDRLTDYVKNLNEEEFTQAFGVDYTKENHADMVQQAQNFTQRAEEIKDIHSKLSSDYGNPFNPGNFKHGTKEYIKEALNYVSYKEAINQLTFMQDTYNRAVTRQQQVLDGIKRKPGFENVPFTDIYSLTSISHLSNEIDLLQKEADASSDKSIKAQKEKKIKQLSQYNIDLVSYIDAVDEINKNKDLDPKKKTEQLNAALDAFTKAALPTFTSHINEGLKKNGKQAVQDNNARAAFENLTDYFHLQADQEGLLQNLNYIVDPINFSQYLNRHSEEMVKYFANKAELDKKAAAEKAKDKRTAEDVLSGAVIPEDGETADITDLTEDDYDTEVPKTGSINVEQLQEDIRQAYIAVIKSNLEIATDFEGGAVMLPSQFLIYSSKATAVLSEYGVSPKDFTTDIVRPTASNYKDVKFTYTGAKSSNSADQEVEGLNDVETVNEEDIVLDTEVASSEEQPSEATPETAVQEPVIEDEEFVDPEQEEFDNNPDNSLEVSGTKFIMGHYIVPTDGSDALKIISVTDTKVWATAGTETEVEFTKEQLAEMLSKGQIEIAANPKAKQTKTPIEPVTDTQKKEVVDKKKAQEEDVDFDSLEYTADTVGFSYPRTDSDGSTVYEDSRTPIDSGSKINNSSDSFTVYTDKKGVRRLKRGDAKSSYPLILATNRIRVGTALTFEIDTNIDDFDDYDYVQQTGITKRTKSDFFNADGTIKPEAIDDFPVAIYATNNGKKIKLGYLPTVKFVTARYNDSGVLAHTKEFQTLEGGEIVNNLELQTNALKQHRETLFKGYNTNKNTAFASSVTFKSNGVLRTDGAKKTLRKALSKNTRIGIVKQGKVHFTEKFSDPDLIMPSILTSGQASGWPVAIIPTPTGKSLASLVTVPVLKKEQLDFILGAWTSFHTYNNAVIKGEKTAKKDLAVIEAVYKAYGIEFIDGETADFKTLGKYINDYNTYTSSEMYSPMKQGKAHFNITPKGLISVWQVNTGDKKKDSVIMGNINELSQEKIDKFYDIAANLRQSVRFGTADSAGIGNDKLMTTLTIDPESGALSESKPMTYNDFMLDTLETTLEEGRPYDENNIERDELIHFSNPVVVFGKIDSSSPAEGTKPSEAPKAPAPVAPTEVVTQKPSANGVEAIQFKDASVTIQPIVIEGNNYNVVNTSMRPKALVNVNGVIVPFYITSGLGGKGLTPGWYPFFGIGKDGWMNKTDKSDMETYYERYWGPEVASKIKGIAEELNAFYGTDSKAYQDDKHPTITEKPLSALADAVEDHINEQLSVTPTSNNQDNTRINLRANVEQLGKEITAKEADKVADSAYINVAEESKSETPISQDDAIAKFMDMNFGEQFGTNQAVNKDIIKGNEDQLKSVATTVNSLQKEDKLNKKCN